MIRTQPANTRFFWRVALLAFGAGVAAWVGQLAVVLQRPPRRLKWRPGGGCANWRADCGRKACRWPTLPASWESRRDACPNWCEPYAEGRRGPAQTVLV